jgi:syntaxin 1B/2/3
LKTDDTPTPNIVSPPPDVDRANFLNHLEQVRNKFNELDQLTNNIHGHSDRLESCTTSREFRRSHDAFSTDIQQATQLIKMIKSQLDALETSNNDFQQKHASGGRESDFEFRRVAWNGFANRLRSSLLNFNRAQSEFEKVYTSRTGASGFNPDLTLMQDTNNMNDGGAVPSSNVQRAFAAAVDEEQESIKKEDMKRLERSMREIREAFIQIAALVDSQGEMLDCIEFSVVNAKHYSHQANLQLIQARKKQRQRSCIWIWCGIILLLGLILGILGIVGVFKK